MAKTLKSFITEHSISLTAEQAASNANMINSPEGMSHWMVTITGRFHGGSRRQMTTAFSMGSALVGEPQPEAVLDCLISDAAGVDQSFEDWARDLGMDPDSRKAEASYKACQASAAQLKTFLGEEFSEALTLERE